MRPRQQIPDSFSPTAVDARPPPVAPDLVDVASVVRSRYLAGPSSWLIHV